MNEKVENSTISAIEKDTILKQNNALNNKDAHISMQNNKIEKLNRDKKKTLCILRQRINSLIFMVVKGNKMRLLKYKLFI